MKTRWLPLRWRPTTTSPGTRTAARYRRVHRHHDSGNHLGVAAGRIGTRGHIPGSHGSVHGQHDRLLPRHGASRHVGALEGLDALRPPDQRRSDRGPRIVVTDGDDSPLVEHHWSKFPRRRDHPHPTWNRTSRPHLPGGGPRCAGRDEGRSGRPRPGLPIRGRFGGPGRPCHQADDIAQIEGYPSKILQGMCTFALASGALVDLLADGDPYRLDSVGGALRRAPPSRADPSPSTSTTRDGPKKVGGRSPSKESRTVSRSSSTGESN